MRKRDRPLFTFHVFMFQQSNPQTQRKPALHVTPDDLTMSDSNRAPHRRTLAHGGIVVSDGKFRVGFIGAGGIALTHMKYLAAMPDVEIVAAADISERSLAVAKAQYQIEHLYTDHKVMLREQPTLDAISVCTPNGLHAVNSIDASNAGKHVLVEKPMAMNAREARQMLDAAKRNGKHLVVGFQSRFDTRTKLIRDQIRQGNFGNIMYIRAQAL